MLTKEEFKREYIRTMEEYQREYIRMMDSMREGSEYSGEANCKGVDCNRYPLYTSNSCSSSSKAFEIIEIVEKWSKEHPVVTNRDKFKEVFGIEPKVCPRMIYIDIKSLSECLESDCKKCTQEFWDLEYKVPVKENEDGV